MAENTPFAEIHKELDAKMIPAGKWKLPLFYPGGSVSEHRHTCENASLFDFTGCGCFQVTGKNAAAILDKEFMRECAGLAVGANMKNVLLRENGRFSVIFTMCRMQEDDFMLLVPRDTPAGELSYLLEKLRKKLTVRELSGNLAQLVLAGKKSTQLLASAVSDAAMLPGSGEWKMVTLLDEEGDEFRCIAVNSVFFGETAYHLCFNAEYAEEVYGALYRIPGIAPAGMGAWESLRLESMECAVNAELTADMFPQECGLEKWIVPGRSFCGKDAVMSAEISRNLVMLELGRHPLPPGTEVMDENGDVCGCITSSSFCPVSGCAAAWCRIKNTTAAETGAYLFCRQADDSEIRCAVTAVSHEA